MTALPSLTHDTVARSRFTALIRRDPCGCWRWTGRYNSGGRVKPVVGSFHIAPGHPVVRATRAAWALFVGAVGLGETLSHGPACCCIEACVNPGCLVLGQRQRTVRDSRRARGSRVAGAKLTESDVRLVRQIAALGVDDGLIARGFGVHRAPIWAIRVGRAWRQVA